MLGTIYPFGEVFVDEFFCIHVILPYPTVGFWSIAFPFDEVVCDPVPWFPGFSSDFVLSTVDNCFDFEVLFTVDEIWRWWRRLFLVGECGWRVWREEYFIEYWMDMPVCQEF